MEALSEVGKAFQKGPAWGYYNTSEVEETGDMI